MRPAYFVPDSKNVDDLLRQTAGRSGAHGDRGRRVRRDRWTRLDRGHPRGDRRARSPTSTTPNSPSRSRCPTAGWRVSARACRWRTSPHSSASNLDGETEHVDTVGGLSGAAARKGTDSRRPDRGAGLGTGRRVRRRPPQSGRHRARADRCPSQDPSLKSVEESRRCLITVVHEKLFALARSARARIEAAQGAAVVDETGRTYSRGERHPAAPEPVGSGCGWRRQRPVPGRRAAVGVRGGWTRGRHLAGGRRRLRLGPCLRERGPAPARRRGRGPVGRTVNRVRVSSASWAARTRASPR